MNILVVDDEKEIADVIELYLQNDRVSDSEALYRAGGTGLH